MALTTAQQEVKLNEMLTKFDLSVGNATPYWPSKCLTNPSDGADEKYGWLGNIPGMREWLGARVFNQLRAATYTLPNKEWENSLLVKKTDLADDRAGLYGPLLQSLGVECAHHPDELWFTTLINGTSTTCFDGQFFFDTDHAWGDSGTQSNDLTYTCTDPDNPTDAEFKAAWHLLRRTMLGFKRDNGKTFHRPVIGSQQEFSLICPLALEETAKSALTATLAGGGDTNVVLDAPKIDTTPALTNGRVFYGTYDDRAKVPLAPFVFQARKPIERSWKGLDDQETKDVKIMADSRYNIGYLAWWNACVMTLV